MGGITEYSCTLGCICVLETLEHYTKYMVLEAELFLSSLSFLVSRWRFQSSIDNFVLE